MINIDLLLRTLMSVVGAYYAVLSWRKLNFIGIMPILVGMVLDIFIRGGLLLLPHSVVMTWVYRFMLTLVASLHTYGMYTIYKALKKLNGVT